MTPKDIAFSYEPSEEVSPGLFYCEKRQLWWKDGTVYNKRSANHNGLIGLGAEFKKVIELCNGKD